MKKLDEFRCRELVDNKDGSKRICNLLMGKGILMPGSTLELYCKRCKRLVDIETN